MSRRTLICCAYPFGYGPAAKLLHLAPSLRALDLRLVFLGAGIAHELASRSTLFDDVVNAPPTAAIVPSVMRGAAGLLSLMDRDYSQAAIDVGCPVFVIDSLLWMRAHVPPVFRQARRYWAQEFVDVQPRLADVGPHAHLVGPIVAPADAGTTGDRPVVNLGGGEAPGASAADDPTYVDFIARALIDEPVLRDAVVLAGEQSIRRLRTLKCDGRWTLLSATHNEALQYLRTASMVLTAPGLTACLECFQRGVPTFFLPPQNYSQWWILHKLRQRGLAPGSLHWADLCPGNSVTERMPEEVRGPLVRDLTRGAANDERALGLFHAGLAEFRACARTDLARRQRAFFDSLGPNGITQICNDLASLL